ncbi:SRPBCC family protein [Shinella sp. BYT-45]|uniref:SRPBCC family protein n=1 Tax=Shinella sp. BYT-45 TaxID=3377377 RepID=UPI00398114BF
MNDRTGRQAKDLVLEYDLDAPPEKVWRAISIPAFRERWLPDGQLADGAPVSTVPGEEVRYRMRDDDPPHLESLVAFQLRPNGVGGTTLRIVHGLDDAQLRPPALNDNGPALMRAA